MMQDRNGPDSGYLVPLHHSHILIRHCCFVKKWMQDTRCKPGVRVFRWPGSVFGARCPALGVDSVPGPGSQVPGTRDVAGQSGNKAVGQ
jgi:hypothetical protein